MSVQLTLDEKNQELNIRNDELNQAQSQLDRVRDALPRSSRELASNQAETADLARTIDSRNVALEDLHSAIEEQKQTLENQEATLGRQLDQIQQQQSYLFLAALIVLVFIGLSVQIISISNKRNRLNLRLQEANDALAIAKKSADDANRAKGDFVAKMSHEIRTPLNAILGFTEMLVMDDSATDQQKKQLDTISRNGQHLLSMLEDVLDISSIESGALDLHPVVFSLSELIEELKQIFVLQLGQHNLSLDITIESNIPEYIELDKQKLRQILINLVGNSIKISSKGGISIRAWMDSDQTQDGGVFRIDVLDTRPGIEPNQQAQVFERFEQSDSGKQSGTGTGLGLPISKEFAIIMGGDLRLTSTPGQGSAFHLHLPLVSADKPDSVTGSSPTLDGNGQRILVIDDIQSNIELMASILEPAGFEIETADTGYGGLKALKERQFDWVFLDLKLPDVLGDEVLQKIRLDPKTAHFKVVIVTANDLLGEREKLFELGANDFISKPFNRNQILTSLEQQLEGTSVEDSGGDQNNNSRMLIVEDNADIRQLITRIAEQLNFEVTCAEDGQAGLEDWIELKPAVVVTDCNMPRLTGTEMARQIRLEAEKIGVSTKIFGVTGLTTDTDACLEAGMDDVVTKPFRMAQLKDTFIKNGLT